MLLVIDIGNTSIVFGVFRAIASKHQDRKLVGYRRISTEKLKGADKYGPQILKLLNHAGISPSEIKDIIISSVVPSLVATFRELCKTYFKGKVFVFKLSTQSGIMILCDNPKEVGTDRVANALAAFKLYKKPAIVVDFGTATTFDVVTARGEYAGGVIAPGIGVSARALFKAASKLPYVELAKPGKALGKNTIESMQSGLIWGTVGQVKQIIGQLKRELKIKVLVIATGGYADIISKEVESIKIVNPTLTLEGLALIYDRNS